MVLEIQSSSPISPGTSEMPILRHHVRHSTPGIIGIRALEKPSRPKKKITGWKSCEAVLDSILLIVCDIDREHI